MSERTAVVIGASAGVGRALADTFAAQGWHLVITSRSAAELDAVAAALRDTHHVDVHPIVVDLTDDDDTVATYLSAVSDAIGVPDAVAITAGTVADVDEGIDDWPTSRHLIDANLWGVMRVAGHFVDQFATRNRGTVVLFSSIAAGAPRRKNVAYAAAKAGLESFAGSMQHRLGRSDAAVQLYRLGYVDTRLAAGQDLKLPKADPVDVARRVVDNLDRGSRSVFEPRYWGAIVRGLRSLPAPVFNRLDF